MNDINKPNTSPTPAKPAAAPDMWLSKDGIVAVPKSTIAPDPAATAQEAVHQVMPKADVPKPKTLSTAPPKLAPMPTPPKVESDPMSKQQQASMPSVDEIKGKWKQQMGAAKIAWGKLTEDELLKSEGHQQKLAGLVQERYAVTRDEADKQIKAFFDKH
jgi:uncharacterized protein YjbJ (UPF0337 family)